MPTVGMSLMAHPKRALLVDQIIDSFESYIPFVSWDTFGSEWDTGRRAWLEGVGSHATHWLVLQDDAIICRNLLPGVERALEYVPPGHPLSLYFGKARPHTNAIKGLARAAFSARTSFITTNRVNWGVALVVPTVLIPEMIAFCDPRDDPRYDNRISKFFLHRKGRQTWHTWPSLVDHANGESLLGHYQEDRTAHNFIGRTNSALDVDWSSRVIYTQVSTHKNLP